MYDMLAKLPVEVLVLISEMLSKDDLKRLSETSKRLRAVVANQLWQSITIEQRSEYRIRTGKLPHICLQHVKHIHFRTDINYPKAHRCPCPTKRKFRYLPSEEDMGSADGEDEFRYQTPFDRLSLRAESVLQQIPDQQLQSFSWDLGTCVPPKLLAHLGIVPLEHSSIRSLRLVTDPTCNECFSRPEGDMIDLSPFHNLTSLTWRGPHVSYLDTLAIALQTNSMHLKKLELDFVSWVRLRTDLGYFSDDESDVEDIRGSRYFTQVILGLKKRSPPLYPEIRELSLTEVHMSEAMAYAFDFKNIVSLNLRRCLNWDGFLKRVVQVYPEIKLKTLEIQDEWNEELELSDVNILDFLDHIEGLEELFLHQYGPIQTLDLWNHATRHRLTLRRFVLHLRTIDFDEDSPHFEELLDLPDMALLPEDRHRIKHNISQNPLSKLDLEFIGLTCVPELLKDILYPFTMKTSLKVLHIRQSGKDLELVPSWAIVDEDRLVYSPTESDLSFEVDEQFPGTESIPNSPVTLTEYAANGADTADATATESKTGRAPNIRDEFQQFAEWVFGPQGISSLNIVAFGDFSPSCDTTWNKLLLCRDVDETGGFWFLSVYDDEWKQTLYTYGTAIEACPTEALFLF